jgi:hypothetical protein
VLLVWPNCAFGNLPVKALCQSSAFRAVVSVAVMLSWMLLTNHCALGGALAPASIKAVHMHCHGAMEKDGTKAPAQGTPECCRAVKATLPSAFDLDLASVQLHVWDVLATIAIRVEAPAPQFLRDHGPPRAPSFAEEVLQRSLLSHAPPVRV